MGRQYRAPRRGNDEAFVGPVTVPTTGNLTIAIPNYGITNLSTMSGEMVLDAPDAGVRKTLFRSVAGSSGTVVRFSSSNTVSCATLGATGGTQITFNATLDCCVVLLGLNSTHWIVESMYTGLTGGGSFANTTGIVIGGT
jgi:hypothetical protein